MLIYYALCLVMLLLVRPILASKFLPVRGQTSIYAAMYFLPILTVTHAVCGGLLCKLDNIFYTLSEENFFLN